MGQPAAAVAVDHTVPVLLRQVRVHRTAAIAEVATAAAVAAAVVVVDHHTVLVHLRQVRVHRPAAIAAAATVAAAVAAVVVTVVVAVAAVEEDNLLLV